MKSIWKIFYESFVSVRYDALTGSAKPWHKMAIGYVLIPIGLFVALWCYGFDMGDGLYSAIVGFLSLFIALIFQVIYIATDKFTSRYNDCWAECVRSTKEGDEPAFMEDVDNYLIRIGNYTRLFVRQMTFVLLLSIVIIIIAVLEHMYHGCRVNIILSSLMMAFFYLWLVYMIHSIKSIYTLLMDDIDYRMKGL